MSTVGPDEQRVRTACRVSSAISAIGDGDEDTARDWVADLSSSDCIVAGELIGELSGYIAQHLRESAGEADGPATS